MHLLTETVIFMFNSCLALGTKTVANIYELCAIAKPAILLWKPNSSKIIYLIRHCKAGGQESSATLTSKGVEQACKLADFLYAKQIDYIISSSFT